MIQPDIGGMAINGAIMCNHALAAVINGALVLGIILVLPALVYLSWND